MASTNGTPAAAPLTASSAQSDFEQAVALSLHTWPALTLAVQNSWGGEDSSDKRDWLAGALTDLYPPFTRVSNGVATTSVPPPEPSTTQQTQSADPSAPGYEEPDTEYVEEFLLQVMADEFDVNVDDDSTYDVATQIVSLRNDCARGRADALAELRTKFDARKGKKVQALAQKSGQEDEDDSSDDDEDDDGDDDNGRGAWADEGVDVDMDEAPQLVSAPRDKAEPEVDEDGFTKVTRKR